LLLFRFLRNLTKAKNFALASLESFELQAREFQKRATNFVCVFGMFKRSEGATECKKNAFDLQLSLYKGLFKAMMHEKIYFI
jgi:hypothetical protein